MKKALTKPSEPRYNNGHDNEHHNLIIFEGDLISGRYKAIKILGEPTTCIILKAFDVIRKLEVVLKILNSKKTRHGIRERNFLNEINQKIGNIENFDLFCKLYDSLTYKNHFILVLESLGPNLFELIEFRNYKGLPIEIVSFIATQLLISLKQLKEINIIHRDYKPENILLLDKDSISKNWSLESETNRIKKSSENLKLEMHKYFIKLVDFGHSISKKDLDEELSKDLNNIANERKSFSFYLQSRFYRAPEIILGIPYDERIDLFSVGTIIAELYLGTPIFPGFSTYDQVMKIIDVIGFPPKKIIKKGIFSFHFFDDEQSGNNLRTEDEYHKITGYPIKKGGGGFFYKKNIPKLMYEKYRKKRNKQKKQKDNDEEEEEGENKKEEEEEEEGIEKIDYFCDFLCGLLKWDVEKRITLDQAINHPFITKGSGIQL